MTDEVKAHAERKKRAARLEVVVFEWPKFSGCAGFPIPPRS
jgi:hypothetical protein